MSTIHIGVHAFVLSEPFEAGHPLSEAEAQALNGLRAENIRNNLAKKLKKLWPHTGPMPEHELEQFIVEVKEYDRAYRFYERPERSFQRSNFEKKLFEVGQESAQRLLREGQITESELSFTMQDLMTSPETHAEARRRIDVETRVSADALAELLG